MLVDPERIKKIENLTVFFTLLGSARVKAVHRTLMKLSPGFMDTEQNSKFKGSAQSCNFHHLCVKCRSLTPGIWICNVLR